MALLGLSKHDKQFAAQVDQAIAAWNAAGKPKTQHQGADTERAQVIAEHDARRRNGGR